MKYSKSVRGDETIIRHFSVFMRMRKRHVDKYGAS